MDTKLSWTQKLGDAVLAQQSDVMDAVQRLRARAQAAKKLETTKEQKVSVRTEQNKQVIVIEPAQPDTVYVPYYDPSVVYGAWPYPDYPPYYFPPRRLITAVPCSPPVWHSARASRSAPGRPAAATGVRAAAGATATSTNRHERQQRNGNWRHDPSHRQGVRYNNANVANQFGKGNQVRGGERQTVGDRGRGRRRRSRRRSRRRPAEAVIALAGQKGGDRADRAESARDRAGGQRAGGPRRPGRRAASSAGGQRGGDRAGGRGPPIAPADSGQAAQATAR